MGENDLEDIRTDECPYLSYRQDYNRDYDTYCMKSGSCFYQINVKDCDGDIVVLCRQ